MSIPVFDNNNRLFYVQINEIFMLQKEDKTRRVMVKTEKGEFYLPSTLEQISYVMNDFDFAQIDKNKIVNLNKVKHYGDKKVTVDGNTYDVSRRRRAEFEEKLIENRSRNTNG